MKHVRFSLAFAALLSVAPAAYAQEPAPAADAAALEAEALESGRSTAGWLDLQVGNSVALSATRPMPGEVADQVFSRYVKSFSHPIPVEFARDRFIQGGGQ